MLLPILIVAAALGLTPFNGVAQATASSTVLPRVRTLDRVLAEILKDSSNRSATFRHLLEAIERSDVIVYVSSQLTLCNEVEGGLHFVNTAGRQRYLRVVVRPGLSRRETAVVLAHELQHAAEVANATWVRDAGEMLRLYKRIGRPAASRRWETEEAQQVALAVRAEISAAAAPW